MRAFKVAVVDDASEYLRIFTNVVKEKFEEKGQRAEIKTFQNGFQLLGDLEDSIDYDIYLLDIELPDYDGFQLAERIRMVDKVSYIVFITAHDEKGHFSYPYFPYATLYKDQGEEPVRFVLERICDELIRTEDKFYIIENQRRWIRFSLDNVVYIDRQSRNAVFHCMDNIVYAERKSLKDVYQALPQDQFIMISKQTIVNMKHVLSVEGPYVNIENTKVRILTISDTMIRDVKMKMMDYYGR